MFQFNEYVGTRIGLGKKGFKPKCLVYHKSNFKNRDLKTKTNNTLQT